MDGGIFARLSGQSGVTSVTGTRIYSSLAAPKANYPYLVYDVDGHVQPHNMIIDPNIGETRFSVKIFSTSFTQLKALCGTVKTALQDYSGSTGSVDFQRVFFNNESNLIDFDQNTKKQIFLSVQDYTAWCSTGSFYLLAESGNFLVTESGIRLRIEQE